MIKMRKAYRNKGTDYQKEALTAAKDLCYGYEVMEQIRAAKTDEEIRRIMVTARKNGR